MTFTGYLAEFSLPEVLQFLEQGHKTGLLTIRTLPTALTQEMQSHYIWLHQGRIMAAADRLDDERLVSMIAQRGWVSEHLASKISQSCPSNTPMGLWLKSQGMLQAEQLKLLFRTQVVGQVSALFELQNGNFDLDPTATSPLVEMTGLSLPATEVTLMGLRTLRDWTALEGKLPDPTSALSSVIGGQPQLRLESAEWQVWELANGSVSLRAIADQLGLPVEKVQQIAFRLIVVNLAAEVPIIAASTPTVAASTSVTDNLKEELTIIANAPTPAVAASTPLADNSPPGMQSSSTSNVSKSFLHNLVGFLRGKV